MILKSYTLENNKNLFKYNSVLFYGENQGLIDEFKKSIKHNFVNEDILSYNQNEILDKQKNFILEISSQSLFEKQKIFIINSCNDKIFDFLNKIKNTLEDQKIFLFSDLLEKKSKLRNFYEKSESLVSVPCYQDTELTLRKIVERKLLNYSGISPKNINLILDSCNNERSKLNNELEKIATYFSNKIIITEDLIKILNAKENERFDYLKNEALSGNKFRTNNLLDTTLLEQDKSIFYLSSINQGLNKIKEGVILSKDKKISEIVDNIKPPIFWKDKPIFISQVQKWNIKKINQALNKTYDLELMLKSNFNLNKEILIKKVIIDICSLANAA